MQGAKTVHEEKSLAYRERVEISSLNGAVGGGGDMPDRRRFGHVNVVCMYSIALSAGRTGMGAGVEREGLKMGQLTMGKSPARMGIRNHV
jgi:hypothetical protein